MPSRHRGFVTISAELWTFLRFDNGEVASAYVFLYPQVSNVYVANPAPTPSAGEGFASGGVRQEPDVPREGQFGQHAADSQGLGPALHTRVEFALSRR